MLKQKLLRTTALILTVICMFLFAACGGNPSNNNKQTPSPTGSEPKKNTPTPSSEPDPKSPSPSPEVPGSTVAKINGGADEVGIYSIVVKMTKDAADKGEVELVYYGAKGSPQEESVVNTFLIKYYRNSDGTFEINTFFNGEVYQNQHRKEEVKVTNTFDATLRAGRVIITYTPDGGEPLEIFKADADYFRA